MVAKGTVALFVVGSLGAAFVITGGVLIHLFPGIIDSMIDDQVVLKDGTSTFNMWKVPPAPIYFQVWMFNVTNPDEVLKGEKPDLRQIGPYTYHEKREKIKVKFNGDGTLHYRETRTFFFDREMSAGPENDTFTSLNLPMLTIMDMVRYKGNLIKDAVRAVFSVEKEKYFMDLTIGGLMWGYDDPIFSKVAALAKLFHLNISIPAKMGLFYNQNGTDDGVFRIYTGENGVSNFAEIISWNDQKKLNIWTSPLANAINGSDGTLFPPHISTSTTKYLFTSDLCRSLGMDYTEGVSHLGIDMDRFVAPKMTFGNVTINPYNKGFCTPAHNCLPSGLLNVSVCRQGAPIVMSMPHFLGCDDFIINSVTGLHPNQLEHQSFLDLEPMTGVVMNAGKRLQINIHIDEVPGFETTKNLKSTFLPLMWLNESALIDKKDADKFKSEVYGNIKLTEGVKYGLVALGGLMLVIAIIFAVIRTMAVRNTQLNVNSTDEDDALITDHGIPS